MCTLSLERHTNNFIFITRIQDFLGFLCKMVKNDIPNYYSKNNYTLNYIITSLFSSN